MSSSRFKRKRKKGRTIKKIVLVVGEGKSEEYYFNHFNRNNSFIRVISISCKERDPLHLVNKHTKQLVKEYSLSKRDSVWIVFDFDDEDRVESALKIAKEENFGVALSIPSFELWVLLHYRLWDIKNATKQDIENEIKKWIEDYKHGMDVYPLLSDNTKTAIENAKKLYKKHSKTSLPEEELYTKKANPITHVFKLVELLESGME